MRSWPGRQILQGDDCTWTQAALPCLTGVRTLKINSLQKRQEHNADSFFNDRLIMSVMPAKAGIQSFQHQ
jgi:hypothetical protein